MKNNEKVFVLHKDDEIKIIALQNNLKVLFLKNNIRFLKEYPLWVSCNSDIFINKTPKEINEIITNFLLEKLQFEKDRLLLSAKITLNNGYEIFEKLTLGRIINFNKVNITLPEFVLNINIFKTGICISDGYSFCLEDTVWKKIVYKKRTKK
ncbi:MAG: hypothetical protein HUK25_05780 [Treponema sp.]|nr:hypothetical protein [Treponema sp.]